MAKGYKDGVVVKSRVPKVVKRVATTAVILLILFVVSGVVYVYLTGRSTTEQAAPPPPVTQEASPLPKPVPPSPNAPVGVAVSSLTSPVKLGENASISAQTNASSKCTIIVTYGGVASTDSGLAPRTANEYGAVNWTWTVTPATPVGKGEVKITCVFNGRSGVVTADQVVTK